MLRSLGITALVLGSAFALAQPQPAAARDRDDFRHDRGRRENRHERQEWRKRERWENRRYYNNGYGYGFYNYGYNNGYGDPRYGFFDRYGNWHWY